MSSVALALKPQSSVRWTAPTIGEVCRLINGRAYKKSELLDEGRYRVLRVGNFFTSNHWYFSDLELEDDKYCDDGDLLYAWSASFGPRIWSGNKTIYHYHIWKVEPDPEKVLRNYLFYFFEWDKELIRKEQGAGATMIHVSKGSMEARAIPLPSLDEQKRIVAVLNQAFAALDRARTHAEANLADSVALFESWLTSVFNLGAGHWPSKTLAQISENLDRLRVPITKGDRKPGNIPYYGASGIVDQVAGHIFDEDLLLVSEDGANLLARTYPIAFSISGKSWVNNHAHVLKFDDLDTQEFVRLYLNSISLEPFVSGMAQPKLNQKALNSIPIPFPVAEERKRIVAEAQNIRSSSDAARANYSAQLTDLANLRQSLLQKAFSGQLT